MSNTEPHPVAASDTGQEELSLEDTSTVRTRVLTPSEVRARDAFERGATERHEKLSTTAELRVLSTRIKTQRDLAELKQEREEAAARLKK